MGIQEALKVRSLEGLMVNAFGRLAGALLPLALNPQFPLVTLTTAFELPPRF